MPIPLSGWMEDSYVNYSLTQNNRHKSPMQVGLNGTMLEGRNLSYNVQESWMHSPDDSYSGNAGMTYDGTYGSVNGSYSWSRDSQHFDYGARERRAGA
ncbi:fimbria/pilus outer membrane usher protein [Escherichia coli]